jgi:hypothetical protein
MLAQSEETVGSGDMCQLMAKKDPAGEEWLGCPPWPSPGRLRLHG